MKNVKIIMAIAIIGLSFGCKDTSKNVGNTTIDSTAVDSIVVDSVSIDTTVKNGSFVEPHLSKSDTVDANE